MIKEWQTAITGAVGFVGVCATIWGQGYVTLHNARIQNITDRNKLRTALAAELSVVSQAYTSDAQRLSSGQNPVITTSPQDEVFKASIGKLGELPSDELQQIVGFYGMQQQFLTLMAYTLVPLASTGYSTVKPEQRTSDAKFFAAMGSDARNISNLLMQRSAWDR